MLNDENKKNQLKKGPKKWPKLTCQTCDQGYKIEIIS